MNVKAVIDADEQYCYPYEMPSVTVDLIIFTIRDGQLYFLTIQRKNPPHRGKRALPGGFLEVGRKETLEEAAKRELFEETSLKDVFIEQLYTFGDPGRDPRGRIITVAYYALVPADVQPKAGDDAKNAEWVPVNYIGQHKLAFDHEQIVLAAVERLRGKISYTTIAYRLMPKKFTLAELQHCYEIILGRPLDKGNFRRYVIERGLIIETEEKRSQSRGGPRAKLYLFNDSVKASLV